MVLFPWCILCKSTANEHSLFNRKHFSHTMTTWCVWDTTHNWTTTSRSVTWHNFIPSNEAKKSQLTHIVLQNSLRLRLKVGPTIFYFSVQSCNGLSMVFFAFYVVALHWIWSPYLWNFFLSQRERKIAPIFLCKINLTL